MECVKHPVFFYPTQRSAASPPRKPPSAGTFCDICGGQGKENMGTLFQCVLKEGHFVKRFVNVWLWGRIKMLFNFRVTIDYSVNSVFNGLCNLLIRFFYLQYNQQTYTSLSHLLIFCASITDAYHLSCNYPRC
jgi:hypothetical protein